MNNRKIFGAILLTIFFASSAFAQSSRYQTPGQGVAEYQPHLSLMAGMADTDNRDMSTNYGLEVGIRPILPLTTSLELSGNSAGPEDQNAAITRTKLLAKANYNIGGSIPVIRDSYVGAGLGPVVDNESNEQKVELGVAPQAGFNIPLPGTSASLGANTSYTFVGGGKPDVFALNGVVSYWY